MTACRSQTSACLARVTRAEADGTPIAGATAAYQAGSLIEATWTPITDERPERIQRDGCGKYCLYIPACTKIKAFTVTLEFCRMDYRLGEILTASSLVLDDEDAILGLANQGLSADCGERLILELFSEQFDISTPGTPPYIRDVFAQTTKFVPDAKTLNEGASNYKYTATGYANPNFFDGPFNDLPEMNGYTGWQHAEFDEATLPEATCGWTLAPAS